MSWSAPGPSMSVAWLSSFGLTSSGPLVSEIVEWSGRSKSMTSSPEELLARSIACRSEHSLAPPVHSPRAGPLSPVVLTVKVLETPADAEAGRRAAAKRAASSKRRSRLPND